MSFPKIPSRRIRALRENQGISAFQYPDSNSTKYGVLSRPARRDRIGYAGRTGTFAFFRALVTCWSRFRCTFRSSGGVKAIH